MATSIAEAEAQYLAKREARINAPTVLPSTDLSAAGERHLGAVREASAALNDAMGAALARAVALGEALLAAREELSRGEFIVLQERAEIKTSTAGQMMSFARNRAVIEAKGCRTWQEAQSAVRGLNPPGGTRRLSKESESRLIAMHREGSSTEVIAKTFGVSPQTVRNYIDADVRARDVERGKERARAQATPRIAKRETEKVQVLLLKALKSADLAHGRTNPGTVQKTTLAHLNTKLQQALELCKTALIEIDEARDA